MSRNGSGVFSALYPILVGALRASAQVNSDFSDMGTEITNTLPLDGTAGMTGQFRAADGSQSAPGVAFASDTRVGFRRSDIGEMRWVGGSQDRMYIDADGVMHHLGNFSAGGALAVTGGMNGALSDPITISKFSANGVARRALDDPSSWAPDAFHYTLQMVFGGYGAVLPTGIVGEMQAPCDGTIIAGALMLDQTGSVSVDVRKCSYANYSATRPQASDSITASNPLAVSSSVGLLDQTLTGWTVAVTAGDCIRFYINSVTSVTRMTIALRIKRYS